MSDGQEAVLDRRSKALLYRGATKGRRCMDVRDERGDSGRRRRRRRMRRPKWWGASRRGERERRVAVGNVLRLRDNHLIGGPRRLSLDGGAEEKALFPVVRLGEKER